MYVSPACKVKGFAIRFSPNLRAVFGGKERMTRGGKRTER
jgi:hypothetical protein